MASRRDVEFRAVDGIILRGWFYSCGGDQKRPCLIMAQGLSGLKEQFLPSFAEGFQAAGYNALVFDHRNWGASEGTPRNETDPIQTSRDFSDAFDYVASLDEVDPTKIVFWGSSVCGGSVIHAAAFERRIRAVISQVPFVSGEAYAPAFGPHLPGLYEARRQVKLGKTPPLMKLFPHTSEMAAKGDPQACFNDPNLVACVKSLEDDKISWVPDATPQTLLNLLAFEPKAFIQRIAPTPFLLLIADRDLTAITSEQLATYERAREPKRLHIFRDAGHFDPYFGEHFKANMEAQLKFLKEYV